MGSPALPSLFTDQLHWRRARRFALTIGAIFVSLGVGATTGSAAAGAEQQGAQLLRSLQSGEQSCEQLSSEQFEAVGEYVMGQMVGSTARHEAMDQQIRATTGASGEAQAHRFMGERFAGCATNAAPAAFGSMMGMMGGYSGASGYSPGMMGGYGSRAGGDDDWGATTMLVILLVVLAAALAALAAWRPWRRSPPGPKTPLDVLSDRYARGDIDAADYEQRRHALESPT